MIYLLGTMAVFTLFAALNQTNLASAAFFMVATFGLLALAVFA